MLCSCLATHAVLEHEHGLVRTLLAEKMWGVYEHRVVGRHRLLDGFGDPVIAPHSHWYDVSRAEFESVGARVLVESEVAGVHMAVSEDDFYVFFQGHPEYDGVSLLKEYKREVDRFISGERSEYPRLPENYLDAESTARLHDHRALVEQESEAVFPDVALDGAASRWNRPGRIIYRKWLSGLR